NPFALGSGPIATHREALGRQAPSDSSAVVVNLASRRRHGELFPFRECELLHDCQLVFLVLLFDRQRRGERLEACVFIIVDVLVGELRRDVTKHGRHQPHAKRCHSAASASFRKTASIAVSRTMWCVAYRSSSTCTQNPFSSAIIVA